MPPPSKARGSIFHWFGQQPHTATYSIGALSTLCTNLAKTSLVTEKNRDVVVEQLRQLTEQLVWGDRNDPAFFEYFLEKNVLSIFWRFLAQQRSPIAVKVQLLQTLSILLQNIEAGPSVFFILSNNHINELITHPFDFTHEELLTHYVSLLKAIALRLDVQTVQFFITSTPIGMQFPLFDEALKLWNHEERMVRTAVRTIVLSVCQVDDAQVRSFVASSTSLTDQLIVALRSDSHSLSRRLEAAASPSALEGCLQYLFDEMYFLNDLLGAGGASRLSARLVTAIISGFVMPLLVAPLVTLPAEVIPQLSSAARAGQLGSAGDLVGSRQTRRLLALYLLAHCLCIFTHAPLISALAALLLHPKLNLATIRLPSMASTPPVHAPHREARRRAARVSAARRRQGWGSGRFTWEGWGSEPSPHGAPSLLKWPSDEAHREEPSQYACHLPLHDSGPDCNALRSAVLDALADADERIALCAGCVVLAALRSQAVNSELLRQARLLPLRELRAESLLSHLLRTSRTVSDASDEPGGAQYCMPVVSTLLATLSSGPPTLAATSPPANSTREPPHPPAGAAASPPAGGATPRVGRLLTTQLAAEMLVELVHDTSSTPTLVAEHVGALLRAHEAVAARLRAALEGKYAASLSNLIEYEGRQLVLPVNLSLRVPQLLADCSLLLPAHQLPKNLPLTHRAPRDELEATRVTIQAFLLVRHTRNLLLRLPDDVRAMARPRAEAPKEGERIHVGGSVQLLPCVVLQPCPHKQSLQGVVRQETPCLLLVYPPLPASSAPASRSDASAARHGAQTDAEAVETVRREHLILVRQLAEPDPSQLNEATSTRDSRGFDPELLGGGSEDAEERRAGCSDRRASNGVAGDGSGGRGGAPLPAASAEEGGLLSRPVQPHLQVVLVLPLSAMATSVDETTGSRLTITVPRHHAPPGVSAEHPLQIEFGENWRCAAAKLQLEQACLSARAQQHQRLVSMLGTPTWAQQLSSLEFSEKLQYLELT
ncbi:hypothetical protein AB1Y20_018825 [Prymnesium parvum]|uniref:FPL domain-containing protein n=1 Tax=Prymnesium parvum TaxID=97485 RepID=A0AB34JTF2_PRYPA